VSAEKLLPDGLLEIMQCPEDGGALREDVAASQLVCESCGVRYRVRDGIPVMLTEEAIRPAAE
jgi:uncharacterized protein YbaR (Trm112 family)